MSGSVNPPSTRPGPEDIAIVGMDCVYPGAANLKAFWENIVLKRDAISDPPPDWDADLYYDPNSSANDRTYTKKGGFLGELSAFDPFKHGVVPSSVDGVEPDQFLALEITHRALADAGFAQRPVTSDRVEVVLGRGTYINRGILTLVQHGVFVDRVIDTIKTLHPEHTPDELRRIKDELKKSLPPFNAEMAGQFVPNLVSGRIANRLDFQGANYIIDAACASSHIAVQKGVEDLRAGRCDVAVVGGCQASTPSPIFMVFSQLSALSRKGVIRPFDKDADGTLLGEGVGILVLKRLSDAEAAGDRIYAVIKAIGTASDGRAVGLLAPRVEGEVLALKRAYEESGIDPASVELVEAHGTATAVGDAAEIESLRAVFGERGESLPTCALGSVKSMIGHCLPAAGSAGLIKAALALYNKVLPPTLHCENPNPALGLDASPFYINQEARPWIHGGSAPRRAGVNAFGFGGINAHAILEEYRPRTDVESVMALPRSSEVLVLEADTRDALRARARDVAKQLTEKTNQTLTQVARAVNCALKRAKLRLAVVASTREEAAARLIEAEGWLADPKRKTIKDRRGIYFTADPKGPEAQIALMFPGEGSQYPNMLQDLCLHFPEVRDWFDQIDRAFVGHRRGLLPSQVIFPPPSPGSRDKPKDMLWRMDVGPEAVFAASQGVLALLGRIKLKAQAAVGHSTGEYSALIAAGAQKIAKTKLTEDILALNHQYEKLLAEGKIPTGHLIAVAGTTREALEALLSQRDDLYLAMDNCPQQQVVCALSNASAEWIEGQLSAINALCARLPFDRAYHTPSFQSFCNALGEFFERLEIDKPQMKLYSCLSAGPMPDDPQELRRRVKNQWASRVRFQETIERMYEDGISIFVECGPRNNLCAFVDSILKGRPHLACPVNVEHRDGITQLNHLIGQLAVEGIEMDLSGLYEADAQTAVAPEPRRPLMKLKAGLQPLKLAPRPAGQPSDPGKVVPLAAAKGTAPTQLPITPNGRSEHQPAPIVRPDAHPGLPLAAAASEAMPENEDVDDVLGAYFGTMDAFVRQQQEIMAHFLGGQAQPAAPLVADRAGSAPRAHINGDAQPKTPAHKPPAYTNGQSAVSQARPVPARSMAELLRTFPETYPLLRDAHVSEASDRLTLAIKWDMRDQIYLEHHTIGRSLSSHDPSLTGLAVIPLTFTMEAMAEAAALFSGRQVIGMRAVRAHRWIALDGGATDVEIVAKRENANEVHVTVRRAKVETSGPARPQLPFAEGVMVVGDRRPDPVVAVEMRYRNTRSSRWSEEDLYSEVMFHGPKLQAIASMDLWAEDGSEGTFTGLPHDHLFSWTNTPAFLTDAISLDAAGQLIGMWTMDHLERAGSVFPFRMERLDILGPNLAPGEKAKCRARIELLANDEVRSDIDIVGADGRVRNRIIGWWDKRFHLPKHLSRLEQVALGRPITDRLAGAAKDDVSVVLVDDIPIDLLEASGEFWLRAFARLVLSRSERDTFAAMQAVLQRRAEWLLGRIAAKDSVRDLLRRRSQTLARPADVVIASEDTGRPVLSGPWNPAWGNPPLISIAHKAGVALAAAASSDRFDGVGIDIERIQARDANFNQAAFSIAERSLIDAEPADQRDIAATRIWCAKEAFGKALGVGLSEILGNIEAEGWDTDGDVLVTASLSSRGKTAPVSVHTAVQDDFMLAVVAIPKGL